MYPWNRGRMKGCVCLHLFCLHGRSLPPSINTLPLEATEVFQKLVWVYISLEGGYPAPPLIDTQLFEDMVFQR